MLNLILYLSNLIHNWLDRQEIGCNGLSNQEILIFLLLFFTNLTWHQNGSSFFSLTNNHYFFPDFFILMHRTFNPNLICHFGPNNYCTRYFLLVELVQKSLGRCPCQCKPGVLTHCKIVNNCLRKKLLS